MAISLFDNLWPQLTGFFTWTWLGIALALTASALLIELVGTGWQESALRRLFLPSASVRHDWAWFVISASGLTAALIIVFTLGLSVAVGNAASRWAGLNLIERIGFWPAQLAVLLLLRSFLHYWVHRISHRVPALWELHKYHHSATEMSVATAWRAHPLDSALYLFANAFPLALLGGDIWGITVINYASTINVTLGHSNVPWTYGWVGRWILMSPAAHRVHHSDRPEHFDRNFGVELLVWDRIFGTWYKGDRPVTTIGVAGSDLNTMSPWTALVAVPWRAAATFLRPRSVPAQV